MKKQAGFTVIEVMIAVVVLTVLAVFFIAQRSDLEKAGMDKQRKIAINTMYYALKEGYFKEHGYYPRTISRETLPTVDPTLFTDPGGATLDGDKCMYVKDGKHVVADGKCQYHYAPENCNSEGHCQGFKLTADLQMEQVYQKSSYDN